MKSDTTTKYGQEVGASTHLRSRFLSPSVTQLSLPAHKQPLLPPLPPSGAWVQAQIQGRVRWGPGARALQYLRLSMAAAVFTQGQHHGALGLLGPPPARNLRALVVWRLELTHPPWIGASDCGKRLTYILPPSSAQA